MYPLKTLLNKLSGYLFLAVLFLASAFIFEATGLFTKSNDHTLAIFNRTLHLKETQLEYALNSLSEELKSKGYGTVLNENKTAFDDLYINKGIILLGFENDSLVFWSHNAVPVNNYLQLPDANVHLLRLQNGWYETIIKNDGNRTLAGLLLIKNEYPHQNQYLVNGFQKDFNMDPEVKLSFNGHPLAEKIYTKNGKILCSLIFPDVSVSGNKHVYLAGIFYLVGFIFLLVFFHQTTDRLFRTRGTFIPLVLFFGTVITLRILTIQLKIPAVIYDLPLFNPVHYATSFLFPSLGDFLINSILIFYLSYFLHKKLPLYITTEKIFQKKTEFHLLAGFFILSIVFVFSWQITEWIKGLIENSRISFNVTNIFSLNIYSYTGLGIIGLLLFSFFIISDKAVAVISAFKFTDKQLALLFLFSAGLFIIMCYLQGMRDMVVMICSFPVLITAWWTKNRQEKSYSFTSILIVVLLFSGFASHIFTKYSELKEKKSRSVLIQKLAQEKDPVAEFLFSNMERKITADIKSAGYLTNYWANKKEADKYIKEKYFEGFWDKYDLQFTACHANDSLLLSSENQQVECISFFENLISEYGQQINNSNLYFLNNNSGRISYIARLAISKRESPNPSYLFIELDSKFIPEGSGYPELLLDLSEIKENPDKLNYSYAKYKNYQLVSKSGNYKYSLNPDFFGEIPQELIFINKENYNHLLYKIDDRTLVVLSKLTNTRLDVLTTFSYLFAFFSIFLLLVLFIRQMPYGFYLLWNNFKSRIQVLLIGTIVISILLFGAGTIYYIQKQYRQKNDKIISEKIRSVLIELEHKLAAEPALKKEMKDYMTFLLVKFSNVFFTDINLYDLKGSLIASSRQEIFDVGLLGGKMNTEAFCQMAINAKTEFIHEEKIGSLKYLSAYVPFKNEQGEHLAYLNLPYFSKQNELEKEISFFLEALINIYVLLFVLSVLVAIFISNYITGPLQLIRSKLRNVTLGKSNELIEWKGKDEIGSLVNEYNRMIIELTESAERLAKSERESAWREMAKQVAHEIKNPLTPMKLSVQHLERTWKDNDSSFDKKLERFTQTLIEQIDTLTNIADEFSNFAKMPKANNETFDLSVILGRVIHLFKDTQNTDIIYRSELPKSNNGYYVHADKEQLLRVFNNLLKNAIQAIPKDKKGMIDISVFIEKENVIVAISDNGIGISEEQKEKIFVPSFTTKTGGMGLGLAIVKNIVQSAGGKVWFTTKEQIGSTFYVSLPAYFP